jgi:hypothetical protein
VSESAIDSAPPPEGGDGPVSLIEAVGQVFSSGRALVADAADLVAAEAHVALQMLTGLVVSAVCAAVLGVLAGAGLLAAVAMELIEGGLSGWAAACIVALACALGAALFVLRLRSLARRALFARSRQQLRGRA